MIDKELGSATAENGDMPEVSAPAGGKPAQIKGVGKLPTPILFGDVIDADCAELRDIAEWFEKRGKPMQGEFLRKVALRHEVIAGAYATATRREKHVAMSIKELEQWKRENL